MLKRRYSPILAGLAGALIVGAAVAWPRPLPAEAQIPTNCPQLVQAAAQPAPGAAANQAAVQNARLSTQQKQSLCLAAEQLERTNLALTLDLANALFPGSLGPVGPLSQTDIAAHVQSPESGAIFDATIAAATAGLSGSILANGALLGYLRELARDVPDPNFTQPVQPVTPPIVFPSPAPETNPDVAAAFQSLLVNEVQAVGVSQALVYSLRKAQGAAQAGNQALSQQHLRASGLYAVQLATLLNRESRQRLQMQGALLGERLPVSLGDPALVQALDGAAIQLVQFGNAQGIAPPVFPPPFPPSVPVALALPPAPPVAPAAGAPASFTTAAR